MKSELIAENELITILVADDHPLVRNGVVCTLERSTEVKVVGEAQNFTETLQLIEKLRPNMLILDVEMPGGQADQLTLAARELLPELKILILTAHLDEATIRRLVKVKISGYILKDEAPELLLQAVRTISKGAAWFSQSVAQKMMGLNDVPEDRVNLTPREKQILKLISQGKDNGTIAQELYLAEQTVRNYASTIYEKIGVATRVEAVVWALENVQS